MILNALEAANGLSKNNPLAGIFVGEFKNFLTSAHLVGAKDRERFFQSVLDNLPARAGADNIASRHLNLVELDFGYGDGKACVNRRDRNSRAVAVGQNERGLAVLCACG